MEELSFVMYDQEFLSLSWMWLNDPEVKYLTNTPDFTKEDQKKWFESLRETSYYKVWGIKCGNRKIGVVGLKNIFENSAEYFGFIGDKDFWNKGSSKKMLDHVCSYAKKNRIENLRLTVIKDNIRAIKAYQKYGFKLYEEKNSALLMCLQVV